MLPLILSMESGEGKSNKTGEILPQTARKHIVPRWRKGRAIFPINLYNENHTCRLRRGRWLCWIYRRRSGGEGRMKENQLLRALKEENLSLKEQVGKLKTQNQRLWGLVGRINRLGSNRLVAGSRDDLMGMINEILIVALEAVASKNGSVLLYDGEEDELVFAAVKGARESELLHYRIPADQGIAGWVGQHRRPVLVADVRADERWSPAVDQSVGFHTRSLMAVPLIIEDRLLGVMELVNSRAEGSFNDRDLELFLLVGRLASFVFGFAEEALNNASFEQKGTG